MSTSDRRCSDGGSRGPREACTADIESSTVTRCTRPPVRSFSLRPRAGRISASPPCTTCERLSLVETCTVSAALRIAASVASVSGAAPTKLPPMPKKTRILPSRSAWMEPTVSRPCSRGGSKPNSSRIASRKWSGTRSQMPMVRSPCTLECPRTGHTPAPGLPMLPWSSATLTISLIVPTALWCWVMPIAQQVIVAGESAIIRAASVTCSRERPVEASTLSQSRSATWLDVRVVAGGVLLEEVVVDRVPLDQQRADRPGRSARSPLSRIGRCRSASAVPTVRPLACCGFLKRTRPASWSGLIEMIRAPRDFASSSADSIRGWLVPGFCPTTSEQLGLVDVLEADRALADADGVHERGAGRLVAHVGAVGQVVGAEGAHEELVDERRLVGGLARGVERGLVGVVEAPQVPGDRGVGVVPRDRRVVGRARAQHHRLGDAALLAEPELGATGEVLHRVGGEELAVEHLARRLLRDGLGAVLAELGRVPVSRRGVRPRAALAVEAVDLVEAGQRGRGAAYAHLADRASHGHRDGGRRRRRRGPSTRPRPPVSSMSRVGTCRASLRRRAGTSRSWERKRHAAHPAPGVVPGTPPGGVLPAGYTPAADGIAATLGGAPRRALPPRSPDPRCRTTQNRVLMAPLTRMRATRPGRRAQRPDGASTTSSGPARACSSARARRSAPRARATWTPRASTATSRSRAGGGSPTPCTRRAA